ncbi:MAG: NAD(P)/FAD-dependent oxidoreductase [Chitinophagaceae bacterium]|nr:NAD(P)/FAD-dependent oxidoreductase [Chitinophagaceae bacterium]
MEESLEQPYDFIIIGAGLGGLLSAALLAKENFRVLVLEKNKQIGGALQSFALDAKLFETSVHYIGSMNEGETLHQLYNYLGIADKLQLLQLDSDCYDEIRFGDTSFRLAQTHAGFVETLAKQFPEERLGLEHFMHEIKHVCNHFPLYNMRLGSADEKEEVIHIGLKEVLDKHISNTTLKHILCGNNLLFAGHLETTPFYLYALVQNSYIESSYKFKKGSAQLAKLLQDIIHEQGGKVKRSVQVNCIQEIEGRIGYVEDRGGKKYYANHIISNLHPAETYKMVTGSLIKTATRKRIASTENTLSAFMVNISLKEKTIPYINHNIYYHLDEDVWKDVTSDKGETPNSYGIYFYPDMDLRYAEGIAILTYMHESEIPVGIDTFRTTSSFKSRGNAYELWKYKKALQIIEQIDKVIPGLKDAEKKMDACTPLTYRDYLNTPQGSMYGFRKKLNDIANTTYSVRTKIPNLYLTGQNINLHGVLGVSITAVLTAAEFVGLDYLVNKISKANQRAEKMV